MPNALANRPPAPILGEQEKSLIHSLQNWGFEGLSCCNDLMVLYNPEN